MSNTWGWDSMTLHTDKALGFKLLNWFSSKCTLCTFIIFPLCPSFLNFKQSKCSPRLPFVGTHGVYKKLGWGIILLKGGNQQPILNCAMKKKNWGLGIVQTVRSDQSQNNRNMSTGSKFVDNWRERVLQKICRKQGYYAWEISWRHSR